MEPHDVILRTTWPVVLTEMSIYFMNLLDQGIVVLMPEKQKRSFTAVSDLIQTACLVPNLNMHRWEYH